MDRIILVVDDDMTSLRLAKKILGEEYRIATVNSGEMVFQYLKNNTPDLILLDVNMPDMDGFEVIQRLTADADYRSIPVIFLTADQDPRVEARCLESGAVDFVSKPFVPTVLKSRALHTIELMSYRNRLEQMLQEKEHVIERRTERISHIQQTVILGMANLIELRDNSTGRHVKNTLKYVEMICEALRSKGLFKHILTDEYIQNAVKAAPLHDVGKIRIPDAILQKPGKLTADEFEEIKQHARYGAEIIDDILGDVEDPAYLNVARDIAHYHHEKWDGTGYPEGLRGEDIPLCARIMAVADVFDALYEDRVYKKGIRPVSTALSIIGDGRGIQFDPVITDVFLGMEERLRAYVGEQV